MFFSNINKSSKLLNSRSLKDNAFEKEMKKNYRNLGQSKISNKLKNIYKMLSGKQIVVQLNEDIHYENEYFEKFLIIEILNAYYSFFSIISSVSYYEFSYDQSDSSQNYKIYLYACTILSICLWINIIFGEWIKLEYDKKFKLIANKENFYSSGRIKYIIIKLVLFFFHPSPMWTNFTYYSYNKILNITVETKINYIFCILILLRFYFIFRYFIYLSSYIYPDSNRICKKYFFEANIKYAIKSLIENKPILTYTISMISLVLVFSFSIRVFERDIQKEFAPYWNSIYYTLITMTTVGYGDYVAKTNEGRTIAMIACIVGVFLISMMIISVNKILVMSTTEINALMILERVYSNKELEESAKKVLLNFSKILRSPASINLNIYKETKEYQKLRLSLKEFEDVYNENKSFGITTFNTIYNTISLIFQNQEDYNVKEKEYCIELKKLKTELEEVYSLMN